MLEVFKPSLNEGKPVPVQLETPEKFKYEKMIHYLGEHYGQCKRHIETQYTEYDYWIYFCMKSNSAAQENFVMNQK